MNKPLLLISLSLLLSACSVTDFFLGEENLSEPVDLPDNPDKVEVDVSWSHGIDVKLG